MCLLGYKGKAKCKDKSYYVDPKLNQCVLRDYKEEVFNIYKTMGYQGMQCMLAITNTITEEVSKWRSVKEWELWWENLQQLTFEEKCKQYQMEISVWFFILTWNFPILRCLIIFLWTRMILPTLDENKHDEKVIVGIKMMSYFTPIMLSYEIWNKITSFVSS